MQGGIGLGINLTAGLKKKCRSGQVVTLLCTEHVDLTMHI